jgi:O-antigen ligase
MATALICFGGLRFGDAITASDALFVLAAGAAVIATLRRRALPVKVPVWLILAAGGLLAAGLLVELFPPSPPSRILLDRKVSLDELRQLSNLPVLARFLFALAVVPLLIAMAASSGARVWLLVDLWLAAVAVNCVVALADYWGAGIGEAFTGSDYATHVAGQPDRQPGLTTFPLELSLQSVMALPVVLARLSSGADRRGALLALLPLLIVGLLLTGSRAGLLGATVGSVLILLLQRRPRWAVASATFFVALFAAGAVGVNAPLLQGAERLSGGGTAAVSDERRTLGWDQALADISNRPLLGYGFQFVRSAHSVYLQLLQAGGPLALVAFALFAGGVLRIAVRLGRGAEGRSPPTALAQALGVGMLVWLLTGIVQNSIFDRFLYIPAGLLLGLWMWAPGTRPGVFAGATRLRGRV